MYNEVKDSGKRQEFDTGSLRDTEEGKGDYSLLPWIALRRFAIHLQNGAKKYGKHNWRKGQPLSRYYSSAIRHLSKWFMGWDDEDHLAAALFNICAILETEELIIRSKLSKDLDDRLEQYADDQQWKEESIDQGIVQSTASRFVCKNCNNNPQSRFCHYCGKVNHKDGELNICDICESTYTYVDWACASYVDTNDTTVFANGRTCPMCEVCTRCNNSPKRGFCGYCGRKA